MDASVLIELATFEPAGATRVELEHKIAQYDRGETMMASRRLACMAELDARDDGGIPSEAVRRSRSKCSSKKAKRAAKTATALENMPEARAALARGEISEEHADALADAAERVSPAMVDAELAGDAAKRPADLFAKQSREWANKKESDADQQARHERQVKARRGTAWEKPGGMVALFAEFDPHEGGHVKKALAREVDRLWRADGGRDGTPDDIRTTEQRTADALANLILGRVPGAAGGTPERPHPK
ncbi:MAG: hypothetical protein GWN07_11950, partial [Actinobacteria bacterium]|nr:hypothetical protein [Actinomycetota bacterium]NIW28011.1 hypothetical protein [Actinomycetota bacterium]NIX20497.1 hypothetical protein [Actinomycetota bacterium]